MSDEVVQKHLQLLKMCKCLRTNAIVQVRGQLCYVENFDITKSPEEIPVTLQPCFSHRARRFTVLLPEVAAVLIKVEDLP